MRQRQGQSLSIESDRSIKVANTDMSFEQVSDGNEALGNHSPQDWMHAQFCGDKKTSFARALVARMRRLRSGAPNIADRYA